MMNFDSSIKVGPWAVAGTVAEANITSLVRLVRKTFFVRLTKESTSQEYDVSSFMDNISYAYPMRHQGEHFDTGLSRGNVLGFKRVNIS